VDCAGGEEYGEAGPVLGDPLRQRKPVAASRHLDVGEHAVDRTFQALEQPERLVAVHGLDDDKALVAQMLGDAEPHERFVLDDQDRRARFGLEWRRVRRS